MAELGLDVRLWTHRSALAARAAPPGSGASSEPTPPMSAGKESLEVSLRAEDEVGAVWAAPRAGTDGVSEGS